MTRLASLHNSRRAIAAIGEQHGVHNIRVFGSVARGEDDPASDVDLLVDIDDERSLLDLGGFQFEVEELLGVRVDVVTARGLKPRIRDRVVREAVPL